MKNLLRITGFSVLLLLSAHQASAQLGGGAAIPGASRSGGPTGGGGGGEAKPVEAAPAPPSPIPGAQANPDAVIPAEKGAGELAPNEALFDAISRGDMASARDALNRGAQLDAHNVLGQTPTEASIDMNRNDITFLLLSMRGSTQAHTARVTAFTNTQPKVMKASMRAQRALPSSDRGQPNLAAGFVGF